MTPAWLSEHVFHGHARVCAATIVPGSVNRGKQSSVFKLRVTYVRASDSSSSSDAVETTRTLFVKRYVKSELPPRSPAHWTRDLYSYQTESRFYARYYARLRSHVALIEPLAVVTGRTSDRFLLVLDSVDHTDALVDAAGAAQTEEGEVTTSQQSLSAAPTATSKRHYVHADCLSASDASHALQYLATLHATALTTPGLVTQAADELWATGGWWTFAKRGGAQSLASIESIWQSVRRAFAPEIAACAALQGRDEALAALATRMARHAAYISAELLEQSPITLRTVVHGDFKSANLFFDASTRDVVAFDWQWCGVALGALDVAYLLNTSVSIGALAPASEQRLLQCYYDAFMAQCAHVEYAFEAFERHYVLATLEYARVLLSGFWVGMTPATCATKFANTNCGLGYRSVPHVLRLIEKLDSGLRMVERERTDAQ